MLSHEKKKRIEDILQQKDYHDRIHVYVLYDIPATIQRGIGNKQGVQEMKKEYMEREIEPWYKERNISDYQSSIALCNVEAFLTKEQIQELLAEKNVVHVVVV